MEIYPSKAFLKECFEEGVPITFGSDAHMPADVGRDFDRALELVKSVGYETIVRFSDRKPEHVQL
jgi:histidinol-phosphatase (PHP family)